jgi:NADH-quinone oxidoreductase subunit G
VETRNNKILRIRPIHNPAINDYWMCDEGRLDFDRFNLEVAETRLSSPFIKNNEGQLSPTTLKQAFEKLAPLFLNQKEILWVLSPFATIEEGWAFKDLGETLDRLGLEPSFGYFQPDPNAKGDDFLHTDEPAPNCKGLREEVGLKAIPPEHLENIDPKKLALFGFGFGDLLDKKALESIAAGGPLLFVGIRSDLFPSAEVQLASLSPMEKSGHWISSNGIKQFIRPALRAPALANDDFQLLTQLQEAIISWEEDQFDIMGQENMGPETKGTEEVRT